MHVCSKINAYLSLTCLIKKFFILKNIVQVLAKILVFAQNFHKIAANFRQKTEFFCGKKQNICRKFAAKLRQFFQLKL